MTLARIQTNGRPKVRIHVNRHHISANRQDGGRRPVYTVKVGNSTIYAHGVEVEGKIRMPDPRVTKPLKCGAVAWIELVQGIVALTEPCSFSEATGVNAQAEPGMKEAKP